MERLSAFTDVGEPGVPLRKLRLLSWPRLWRASEKPLSLSGDESPLAKEEKLSRAPRTLCSS